MKAREFDAEVEPVEPDLASNPSDDAEREILEDYADDPTFQELQEGIADLNDDEAADLIAIAWVGRGDFSRTEFDDARNLVSERHHSAPYPVGMPFLATIWRKAWRSWATPVTRPNWRTCGMQEGQRL